MTEQIDDFFTANQVLVAKEVLEVDDLRLMYRLEMAGEEFYRALANSVEDPEAKELFTRNGREERGHADRIRRAIGVKLGRDYQPDEEDQRPLAVNLPEEIPLELLPHIAQGELDGDASYARWAEAETDPEVQRLLLLNAREETVHAGRVNKALEILQAPAAS